MAEGTIRKLTDKAFGFISTEGADDPFLTHRALKKFALKNCVKAKKVTFVEGQGSKGARAENVRPL